MKTYQVLARAVGARIRCSEANNLEWVEKHGQRILELLEGFPSGSGFDKGTRLDTDSTAEKLIFNTSFHHMNDGGYYDGWTEHQVIVTPSLEMGYRLKVTGRDRNHIKEMIAEQFSYQLDKDIEEYSQQVA